MKSAIAFVTLFLLASTANAVTVGEAAAGLCASVGQALNKPDFSTLAAVLKALNKVELGDLPEGNFVVAAPTNEAFEAALTALNVTAEDLLADEETLSAIAGDHIFVETPEGLVSLLGNKATLAEGELAVDGAVATVPVNAAGPDDKCTKADTEVKTSIYILNDVIVPAKVAGEDVEGIDAETAIEEVEEEEEEEASSSAVKAAIAGALAVVALMA